MFLLVLSTGEIRCLYDEMIDLTQLGPPAITRASHVEPDASGQWWADLSPVDGPQLGPFHHRTEALGAEHAWLELNWLDPQPTKIAS
jgi:hypothetical protein